jgi:HlyD family secretion protein
MRWLLGLLLGGALAFGGWWLWQWRAEAAEDPALRTAPVERRDLVASITATGTLEPEEVVDVGAQVAGRIASLGPEPHDSTKTIDYGSLVEQGSVLALIDEAMYKTQVEKAQAQVKQADAQACQSEALVEQAEATVKRAEADLLQLNARLVQTERDWKRAQHLRSQKGILSESEYDLAQATYETARANVEVGQATLSQALAGVKDSKAAVGRWQAAVDDARATLHGAEINLGYCTIRSPVHGVIVDRRVNVGQTVVASLNAPSLFLIAKDLRRMQIWVSVNEADIGQIHPGQPARFTVDAYPDDVFTGEVLQIRLNASMTQNVVTYTVVVTTDNSDGKLLPYLTANVEFEVARREQALVVPNAALRFRPPAELIAPDAAHTMSRDQVSAASGSVSTKERRREGTVWVVSGASVRPVVLQLGLTDGTATEVVEGDLRDDDILIIGVEPTATAAGNSGASPFSPRIFGGRAPAQ